MQCRQCGQEIDHGAAFCSHCGAPAEASQPEETEVSASLDSVSAEVQPERLVRRLYALLIDLAILTVLVFLIVVLLKLPWLPPVVVGAYFFIEVLLGYTPGKRILKMVVMRADGSRAEFTELKRRWTVKVGIGAGAYFGSIVLEQLMMPFMRALMVLPAALLAYVIPEDTALTLAYTTGFMAWPLLITCIPAFFGKRKTLHDRRAGTTVFHKEFIEGIGSDVEVKRRSLLIKRFLRSAPRIVWRYIRQATGIWTPQGKFSFKGLCTFPIRMVKNRARTFVRGALIGGVFHFFAVALSGGYNDVATFPTNLLMPSVNLDAARAGAPGALATYPIASVLWGIVAALISYGIGAAKHKTRLSQAPATRPPGDKRSGSIAVLVTLATGLGAYFAGLEMLLADDGGFSEWGTDWGAFIEQGGLELLLQSGGVGLLTGLGALLGEEAANSIPQDLLDEIMREVESGRDFKEVLIEYEDKIKKSLKEKKESDEEGGEEEGAAEEELEKEGGYFLSIGGGGGTLHADGQGSISVSASVTSTYEEPAVSPAELKKNITFSVSGGKSAWVSLTETGPGKARITATAPDSDDLDYDGVYHATVRASVGTPDGTKSDSKQIDLVLDAPSAHLVVSPSGGCSVKPDGEQSVTVSGEISCDPANATLQSKAADSIRIQCDSDWLHLSAEPRSGDSVSVSITAKPPGGDYSLDLPEAIDVTITGSFLGQSLTKKVSINLSHLSKRIEAQADTTSLPVYGSGRDRQAWIWARVVIDGVDEDELTELTRTLKLTVPSHCSDWINEDSGNDTMDDGCKGFVIETLYPYAELPPEQPPAGAKVVIGGTFDGQAVSADVAFNLQPLPGLKLNVEEPEKTTIKADGEDGLQLSACLDFMTPVDDPEVEKLLSLYTDAITATPMEHDGWLECDPYEVSSGEEFKSFWVSALNPQDDFSAEPPQNPYVRVEVKVGELSFSEEIGISIVRLSTPTISLEASSHELKADKKDEISITATLSLEPADESVDLLEAAGSMHLEMNGEGEKWLQEARSPETGSEYRTWFFHAQNPGIALEDVPKTLEVEVTGFGKAYEEEFESEEDLAVTIFPLMKPKIVVAWENEDSAVTPKKGDSIRLDARIGFEDESAVEGDPYAELAGEIAFHPEDDAKEWLTLTDAGAVTVEGHAGTAREITASVPAEVSLEDIDEDGETLSILVSGKYEGIDVDEAVDLTVLRTPSITVDSDRISLKAGGDDPEELEIEVKTPGKEDWEITWSIENYANHLTVEEVSEEQRSLTLSFLAKSLDDVADLHDFETKLKIEATSDLYEEPLKAEVEIYAGSQGLQLIHTKPLEIEMGQNAIAGEFRAVVRTMGNEAKGEGLVVDLERMQTLELGAIEPENESDEETGNVFSVAKFELKCKGVEGDGEHAEAAWEIWSKIGIPAREPEPGGKQLYPGVLPIKVIGFSESNNPEYCKEAEANFAALDGLPGSESWQKEKEFCAKAIEFFVDYETWKVYTEMLDRRAPLLGVYGMREMRHIIWRQAAGALLDEAKRWDETADYAEAQENFLYGVRFIGELAQDALADIYLPWGGPIVVGLARPHIYKFIEDWETIEKMGFYEYAEKYADTIIKDLYKTSLNDCLLTGILITGGVVTSPGMLVNFLGKYGTGKWKFVPYALHFIYNVVINLAGGKGIYTAIKEAAKATTAELANKWLVAKMEPIARARKYRLFDDPHSPIRPDELTPEFRQKLFDDAEAKFNQSGGKKGVLTDSGMDEKHLSSMANATKDSDSMFLFRDANKPTTHYGTDLATKGMHVKGKSSDIEVMNGLIPVDQKFSKVRHAGLDSVEKSNLKVKESLDMGASAKKTGSTQSDIGAHAKQLEAQDGRQLFSVENSKSPDGHDFFFKAPGSDEVFPYQPGKKLSDLTAMEPSNIPSKMEPVEVLADANGKYLSADYDLLTTGTTNKQYQTWDDYTGVRSSEDYHNIKTLNDAAVGPDGAKVVHHGSDAYNPYAVDIKNEFKNGGVLKAMHKGEVFTIGNEKQLREFITMMNAKGLHVPINDRWNLYPVGHKQSWIGRVLEGMMKEKVEQLPDPGGVLGEEQA